MYKNAVVFPGQGSQKIGMLLDYYNKFEEFRNTFNLAKDVLGYDLWDIIQNSKKINITEFTQPIILTSSFAIWNILNHYKYFSPIILSGHSLGEYTALVCAGSLSFIDGLKLVQLRGKLMQSLITRPCGMVAVIGLEYKDIIECCILSKNQGIIEPANLNSPYQIVVSGELSAITYFTKLVKLRGAKLVKVLPISIPSHSSLMNDMSYKFSSYLKNVKFLKPKIKILHNFDVQSHNSVENIRTVLVKQLCYPVRWTEIIHKMKLIGITSIIECGCSKILTSLNKRITNDIQYFNTSTVQNLNKVKFIENI